MTWVNQMPEPRSRRRPGENREHLIEAGLHEFGLSGYHGTSTARIAARAGVPQPHVYANFRTKHELFLACVSESVARVRLAQRLPGDALLVFQALAAMPDPALGESLRTLLTPLREYLGAEGFADLLESAATRLLSL
ncbi:TetR/AcrR family transcriptional regulator [Leucobacter sp. 7(1)]|uniref:TetR/AcrR family transcriptional regulator n=1 Tax=Leucobacter sp. 7(1) TaxID=1255613 RepID=UPI001121791A|nr:helix-turn-helix domain-containing protein [Leucobacter sp. 7(1)]